MSLGRAFHILSLFFLLTAIPHGARAVTLLNHSDTDSQPHYLLAQAESDETYDPFADYSEFDEASDEEADINFFKNGRFFTIGLAGGLRGFTQNLSGLYNSAPTYGFFLSYFFDLNIALQLGLLTGDHAFNLNFVNPSDGVTYTNTGSVSMTLVNMHLKYYFNTQNVTKGLADLNPYMLGGVSQTYRTYQIADIPGYSREAVLGLDGGFGLEVPLLRRKSFFGIQVVYHLVEFKDENSYLVGTDSSGNQVTTSAKPKGDTYDIVGILGLNF